MNIHAWAKRWGIGYPAVNELMEQFGIDMMDTHVPTTTGSEAGVSQRVRLQYAGMGAALWRNNVGAFADETGRWIRYGLANESSQMNKSVKSSDLIGVMPVTITPEHVGTVIGQFLAIETKAPNWSWSANAREVAQHKFHQIVVAKGGIGKFVSGIDDSVTNR